MRAPVILASVLWFCVSASSSLAADWSTIRIGTDGTYPPWNSKDSEGELVGFEIDLARDLCRRMAATCEVVTQRWNGMIPALTTKKYDAIMAGMAITTESERMIGFSSCYASKPAVFAVHPESALTMAPIPIARIDLATLEPEDQAAIHALRRAFAGAIIGTQIATPHSDFLLQFFDDVAQVQQYDTLENLALDLDTGRIDIALSTRDVWQRMTARDQNTDFALVGPDMTGGIFGRGIGVGIRVEDVDLRSMFDNAIAGAIDDGTVAQDYRSSGSASTFPAKCKRGSNFSDDS